MNQSDHMNWIWNSFGTTSMLVMMILHIAIIVGIIYFVIYLIKIFSKVQTNRIDDQAMKILEERFAKGEINEEEFKRMKKLLLGSSEV